jgi:hypothetical protein
MARRQEGVESLDPAYLKGSRGNNGDGVDLPTSTYRNPGATPNLRGVEANTGKAEGSNIGEPVMTQTFGSEVPRGEVFHATYEAGNVTGPGDDRRTTADSSARNSHVQALLPDSFSAVGESYPANGGLDGES